MHDASRPHGKGDGGEDHSWFVGYAPYDDPTIVVSVVIERGGTGANAAAPVVCRTMGANLDFDPDLCGQPRARAALDALHTPAPGPEVSRRAALPQTH